MIISDAAAFVEKLANVKTTEEVGAAFFQCFQPYGYIATTCGDARNTPTGLTYEFFFTTWPREWLTAYQERDYVRHDLTVLLARLTALPFSWQDVKISRQLTAQQEEHRLWIESLGIADGFAVPIHYPGGDFGLAVTASDHVIQRTEERLALHMASIYTHHRCRELGGVMEASSVKAPLTAREVECLRWVLKGKSDTDIGAILDISHTTVHFHIERVKKKLGVKTRTQAAAMCAVLGYV